MARCHSFGRGNVHDFQANGFQSNRR
jgi:hypothetical protein